METGYDILFFWVARMMMMGLHFMKKVPFRTIFLHAMVVDERGEKMSKVKGNVIDPLDVIHGTTLEALVEKARRDGAPESALANIRKQFPEGIPPSGADALRFTLTAMAAQGRNIRLAIPRIEGYRHFANKIWNATRFALMNLADFDADRHVDEMREGGRERLAVADRWILSRLSRAAREVDEALEAFRLNDAAQALYRFLWSELCDWYIELSKSALYDRSGDKAAIERRRMAQGTLAHCLKTAMELLHPFMPFLTEEVWQSLPKPSGTPGSVMITLYPTQDSSAIDEAAEATMALVQEAIVAVRNIRSEYNVGPAAPLEVTIVAPDGRARSRLEGERRAIAELARTGALEVREAGEPPPGSVAVPVAAGATVHVRLAGAIDPAAERARLDKDLAKTDKELEQVRRKLGDEKFLARAPEDVVEKEKRRLAECEDRAARLRGSLDRLRAFG
jgi:valyl-tRNA synthetase